MHVARVGDGIDHGGILLTGSPDTKCDGAQVVRVGDIASCDVHGEVTVISGAVGCRTNGMDTAREFDMLSCGGTIVRNIGTNNGDGSVTVSYNGASYSFAETDIAASDDDDSPDGYLIYRHPSKRGTPLKAEEKERNDKLMDEKEKQAKSAKEDTSQTNNTAKSVPVECSMFKQVPDYSMQISKHFNLRHVTVGTAVSGSKYPVKDYAGLTSQQIQCNLKALAVNCLDPIAEKYGRSDIMITSGFRYYDGNKTSQHPLGMAADVQFASQWNGKLSKDEWWERVIWIKNNVPYDQMIAEYLGTKPWIHISFNPSGNRKQLLTIFSKGRSSGSKPGLHLI